MKTITLLLSLMCTLNLGFYKAHLYQKSDSISCSKDSIVELLKDNNRNLLTQKDFARYNFDWQKNMPWIGAVLVGILTVLANVFISKQLRKSNIEITQKQISNTKEIALAQIENVRKSVQMDFNKTVLSGNRQAWINDLRDLISRILSKTTRISERQSITNKEYEKLRFLITKTELMLNVKDDEQFIDALLGLENCCLDILIGNKEIQELQGFTSKVKEFTQTTLKSEWERVKKGE